MIDTTTYLDAARARMGEAVEKNAAGQVRSGSGAPVKSFSEVLRERVGGKSESGRQQKKLMDACRDMESLFVSKMLKEMRNSVQKNEWLHGGQAEEIFEDMLYDEYSKEISKNSNLGIAAMLYRELSAKL